MSSAGYGQRNREPAGEAGRLALRQQITGQENRMNHDTLAAFSELTGGATPKIRGNRADLRLPFAFVRAQCAVTC